MVITTVVAVLLLVLSYCIPTERMAKNVAASEATLQQQDDEASLAITGFFNYYDTGTNIIILHEIIYPNTGNPIRDALLVPAADYYVGNLAQWIGKLMDNANNRIYGINDYQEYARYWHGYLIFLKPLFYFLDLDQVYFINTVILVLLVAAVCRAMYHRLGNYVFAYMFFVLFMNPYRIMRSFQLSAVFYALNITMFLLLRFYDEDKKERCPYLFLLDGMLVAFLDFLTYPLVALCVPLLTYVLLNQDKDRKRVFISMIHNAFSFVFGYGGFWAMKWIAASLLTDKNVILEGIENVLHRVGAQEMVGDELFDNSVSGALRVNFVTAANRQTLAVIIGFLLVVAVIAVFKNCRFRVKRENFLISVLIGISPILWYVVVYNHCALHPHLEWRELGIMFYAVAVIAVGAIEKKESLCQKD